eukprot:2392480-Rhodomonas_salina.3
MSGTDLGRTRYDPGCARRHVRPGASVFPTMPEPQYGESVAGTSSTSIFLYRATRSPVLKKGRGITEANRSTKVGGFRSCAKSKTTTRKFRTGVRCYQAVSVLSTSYPITAAMSKRWFARYHAPYPLTPSLCSVRYCPKPRPLSSYALPMQYPVSS